MNPPKATTLNWEAQYRIIPSHYPPIQFFENLLDPDEIEIAWAIESLTNDRLRDEVGDISLIGKEDRIVGPGSSVVMAAFTHIGKPTRFSDGRYGVYYAAKELETAIRETLFHREVFLNYTREEPGEISMRVYQGRILKPLHDIRNERYKQLHLPDNYLPSQTYAEQLRELNSWGIIYQSVRHKDGLCIAALRPPAISIPKPTKHLAYIWDGERITHVREEKIVLSV